MNDVTHYNNFYEFGTSKDDPAKNAQNFKTSPWQVTVEGEVKKKRVFQVEEIAKMAALEERIYRHRCVEGWSIVVPWLGFPLNTLIKQVEPTPKAKYVAFETLYDPKQMPGQRHITLAWGRDYGDVCPIKGTFLGGGTHRMRVSVDVQALNGA